MSQDDDLRLVHYVLACNGHHPDELGRYCCPIPPHVDQNPSSNVRIGDLNGEAILGCFSHPGTRKAWTASQLIELFEGINLFKATARVEDYRNAMQAAGWIGPAVVSRQKQRLDENILRIRREMAAVTPPSQALEKLLEGRPDLQAFGVTPEYLRSTWSLTDTHPDYPGEVYIPFLRHVAVYNDDGEGSYELTDLPCAKHQEPGGQRLAVAGSDFLTTLYGEHLDDGERPVLLCEGESDTWAAHCGFGSAYNVLGLPTGARGPTEAQLTIVGQRQVYLAFDNDDAGNNAALLWKEALPLARRLKLPVNADICALGPEGFGQCEVLDEPYAIDMSEFLAEPDPEWMVDGMIVQGGGIGQIIGTSTAGKTFVALDLALSVCGQSEWLGHKINTNGPVVYACLENPAGFRKRLRAWLYKNGVPPNRLYVIRHKPLNLSKADSVVEFLDGVRPIEPAMVIIDTQAKATAGMDENSAQEAGVMIEYVEAIARELACPVILVHHVGYTNEDRPGGRGSSALFAAMDFVVLVKHNRKTDERQLQFTKLKDGEPINNLSFHIESVPGTGSAILAKGPRANLEEDVEEVPDDLSKVERNRVNRVDIRAKMWIAAHPGEAPPAQLHMEQWLRDQDVTIKTGHGKMVVDRILEILSEVT